MPNELKIADVLSALRVHSDDLPSCPRNIRSLDNWARASRISMDQAFGLINELLCEVLQAKAENEALRKQVADDERKLDALLAHCDNGECPTCAQIICPHGGAMHFHHDGCPSCAEHEAAMAREVSECPKSSS